MTSPTIESAFDTRQSNGSTLDAVSEKYAKLIEVREGVISDCGRGDSGVGSVWTAADPVEELLDPIQVELYNLGWLVAETPAVSGESLKKKAAILADLIEDDDGDLVSALTRSLLRDIARD